MSSETRASVFRISTIPLLRGERLTMTPRALSLALKEVCLSPSLSKAHPSRVKNVSLSGWLLERTRGVSDFGGVKTSRHPYARKYNMHPAALTCCMNKTPCGVAIHLGIVTGERRRGRGRLRERRSVRRRSRASSEAAVGKSPLVNTDFFVDTSSLSFGLLSGRH